MFIPIKKINTYVNITFTIALDTEYSTIGKNMGKKDNNKSELLVLE